MVNNFNQRGGPKRVEVVILGDRLTPDQAQELIRRTDRGFRKRRFGISDYGRKVRQLVGFPWTGTDEDIRRWRATWGAVDLEWLHNDQLLDAKGWCHPDGTIAWVEELEDYPRASELLADCKRLAAAFPDLFLNVAAWGDGRSMLGFPFTDAPESPWPQTLLDGISAPTLGFSLGGGGVSVMEGSDPRLFRLFELSWSQAVERALHETRRCAALAGHQSVYSEPGLEAALPDAIVSDWICRARMLGLADAADREGP